MDHLVAAVAGVPGTGPVEALQQATKVLVGVAVRGLDELRDEVSVPQFRLLVVLDDLGAGSCTRIATVLGALPSTVTRLADHLERTGHLTRVRDTANRSVVNLTITASGHQVVERVLGWRRAELERMVAALDPDDRDLLDSALRLLVGAAGGAYGAAAGPTERTTP